jgi:hypothetical protein
MAQDFAYLRKARHSNQSPENRAGQGEWRDGKDSKEACAGRIDFEEIRASARQPKALNRKGRKAMGRDGEEKTYQSVLQSSNDTVVLRVLWQVLLCRLGS